MPRRNTPINLRQIGITVALGLLVVWLFFLVLSIYRKEEIARTTVQETRMELAALDARNKKISDTVEDFDTERGQEASMRETFGVAKPGEEVIIVVQKKEVAPPPPPTFWQDVKAFFGF